jgi:hypothetical protein
MPAEVSFGLHFGPNCSKFTIVACKKLCDMTQLGHQNAAAQQKTLCSFDMKDTQQCSSIGWADNMPAEASFGLQFGPNCSKFAIAACKKLCDMTQLGHQKATAQHKTLCSLKMKYTILLVLLASDFIFILP